MLLSPTICMVSRVVKDSNATMSNIGSYEVIVYMQTSIYN